MKKIKVVYEYPPIPDRRFDYYAYYDGEEDEQMDTGWGPTPEAAIKDLTDNFPREGIE